MYAAHRVKVNLAARRLLSFPHLLVVLWMLVMLWGERWTFTRQVQSCDWDHWEDWVSTVELLEIKKRCMPWCGLQQSLLQ